MNPKLLILAMMTACSSLSLFAQVQYIVIDTMQPNLLRTPINISVVGGENHTLDTKDVDGDGDGMYDLEFSSWHSWGSSYWEEYVTVLGLNTTGYVLDADHIDSTGCWWPNGDTSWTVGIFPQAQYYLYGDTIHFSDLFNSSIHYMSNYDQWGYVDQERCLHYLSEWVGGEKYLGIKTMIEDKEYLGWVRAEIPHPYKINVKEAAISSLWVSLLEKKFTISEIYPNPASDYFHIHAGDHDLLEVYAITGVKVMECYFFSEGEQVIDCTTLEPGIYAVRLSGSNNTTTKKLVIQ